eukprot:CAMPEP_0171073420 /NCGR_PEP_ID=MMETSP0766_2-20121228/11497_1 /TAXON_ID=439317 /ORGANISM="Gambierdiscus australes, Strain CAWD 149" /LENGTH=486 /DNA_ID=CAMNT_0011530109 /DNA_START=243 /DNA_END=1703 /DNA_ORIENTATION=+
MIDVIANCLLFNACSTLYKLPLGLREVKPWQDAIVLGSHLIFLLPHRYPRLINGDTVDLWYSFVMAVTTLSTAPGICPKELLPVTFACSMLVCLSVSLARLHTPVVIVWNGVYAASTSYALIVAACPQQIQYICLSCTFAVLVCILTAVGEERSKAEIRSSIEARSLQQKESAASALLTIFYEAVVELNSDLVITGSGRQLALFLMCGSGRTLQGSKLEDLLLDEEESQLFRQRMQEKLDKQETMANVLHVAMRKGDGSRIQVELFSFQFEGCSGRIHYLIGIREFSDEHVVEPGPLAGVEGSLSSLPTGRFPREGDREDIWVTIDSAQPDLPILACSDAFQQHVSPLTGCCSLYSLVDGAKELQDWFQKVVNMQLGGASQASIDCANSTSVLLRPQGQPNVRVQSTCRVTFKGEAMEEDEDDPFILQLSFSNLQRVVVVKSRRRSSASSGSGTAPSKVSAALHAGGQSKTEVDSLFCAQDQILTL